MDPATRESFGKALVELGREYPHVVVLDADLSKSTKSAGFAEEFPKRFFQMGIQEANMISTAAGLSFCGKKPFLCSFGAFLTGRFDIIRVSVGYAEANVVLVGTHAGVGIGEDGCSQMGLEDVACMRTLPGMAVIQPADDIETRAAMDFLIKHGGPVYLRLTRQKVHPVNKENYKFELGKNVEVKQGTDAAIFASGALAGNSLLAAEQLQKEGKNVAVINVHSIKPIDKENILKWSGQVPKLFTAEDHNVIGGLGGAVSEVLAEAGTGTPLVRIGVQDVYGESGTPEALYEKHGLNPKGIVQTVLKQLS